MIALPSDHAARERIRTSHLETLFVEAGAGTGKTTTLVARVVQLIATGHLDAIGKLAAITFTENAAAELRSRIRAGLATAAAAEGRDEIERMRCRVAAEQLDDAVITTLHGFAARILTEVPLEAGLPPGFTVEDARGDDAGEQSWPDFLDDLLDDREVRPHLLAGLTLNLRLDTVREVALTFSNSWDRLRERPLRSRPLPSIDAGALLADLRKALRDEGRWPTGDKLTAHLRGTIRALVAELESTTDPLDLLDLLAGSKLTCSLGRSPDWMAAGLDKRVVVAALQAAEDTRAELMQDVGAAVTETIGARVQDWILAEADRRRSEGALNFHDLLVLARDVLRGDGEVRARLHERWSVLLIDEFQDTDPLQVDIAYLLAADTNPADPQDTVDNSSLELRPELEVEAGRLFFVGDAKQSIYRFRRADVSIFNRVGALAHVNRTQLSVNFRSVPGVINTVNHTFGELIGGDPEAGNNYADLVAARDGEGGTNTSGDTVLLLGGPHTDGDAATLRHAEAAHLADVVVRARAQRWPVHRNGATRTVTYQDMAILLPTRTPLPALERALQERSVPYRVESRSLVWATDAVRDLITLLQAIADPADEVALLAALRHPGLACSDVDLLTWRAAGGRWALSAPVPGDLDDRHPVALALTRLRGWHDRRWWTPVNQLVELIVRELRLVELTVAQRRPRDHWRRLRFVTDQARAWCDAGGSGLRRFVAWAAAQIEKEADVLETVVPESDDDAVRILTVHGSKGLEFPVTMVAGLAAPAAQPPTVQWTSDGPQIRLRADVLEMRGWATAADEDKVAQRQEATRLLYVALTRAMDHLVLGCYHKVAKSGSAKPSAAQQLWNLLAGTGLVRCEETRPEAGETQAEVAEPARIDLPEIDEFTQARAELLDRVGARVAASATSLTDAAEAEPAEAPRLRGSSRGAAIGTAVHRVLELVDLANPGPEEVRKLTDLACFEAHIPHLADDVAARVWSALGENTVRAAGENRSWREVYLVVKDGERYVEGYIDLLTEGPDGLIVIDYKTDKADTPEARAGKHARYAPQLAAYAQALEQATSQKPVATTLVFAHPKASPLG